MKLHNVCYTPLDVPPKPKFDLEQLKDWLKKNYEPLSKYKNILNSRNEAAEDVVGEYPWNLTVAYWKFLSDDDPGWLGNFDKEFPELAKYLYTSFNLSIEDLGLVIFLPVKSGHTGLGFWHVDPDWFGLRHYLAFENIKENKLLLKKTKLPHFYRPKFEMPIDENLHLQDEVIECKLSSPDQSFFLNNVRSVHTTYTTVADVDRIAVIVMGKKTNSKEFIEKIQPLVVNSAIKYKDYAILWDENENE